MELGRCGRAMLGKQKGNGAEIYLSQRHTGPWKRAQENSLEKWQETNRSKREKSVSLSIFVVFFTGRADEVQLSFDFQYSNNKVLEVTIVKGFVSCVGYGFMHHFHKD